jgi:hypothetical protein
MMKAKKTIKKKVNKSLKGSQKVSALSKPEID